MNKIDENGAENEFPFEPKEEQNKQSLTRDELLKKTGKQLAALAEPKSTFSLNTLKGFAKNRLVDIILGIEEEKAKTTQEGRAPQGTNESEDIVSMGLSVLQAFKQQREGEQALLNPIAQELFINSAVNSVDKARADGVLKTDKFNTTLLALSGSALVIDGVIGFENIPTLFSKVKAKFSKKTQEQT